MKTKYLKKKEKLEEIFGGILYEDFDFLNQIIKEIKIDEENITIEKFIKICKYKDVIIKFKKINNSFEKSEFKLVSDLMFNSIVKKIENMFVKYFEKISFDVNNYYVIKNTLPDDAKIVFLGDFHSGLHSMIDIFDYLHKYNYFEKDTYKLKDNIYMVCTGDIADRGPYGIETLFLYFLLMLENNQDKFKVILLNGNHEEKSVYQYYGMQEEINEQFEDNNTKLRFERLLYKLPVALFLRKTNSKWYQFCHGGIDILEDIGLEISDLNLKKEINKFTNFLSNNNNLLDYLNFNINFPKNEIEKGFLWSDFTIEDFQGNIQTNSKLYDLLKENLNDDKIDNKYTNIIKNQYIEGKFVHGRNLFAKDKVNQILEKHNIQSIISGHQDREPLGIVFKTTLLEKEMKDDDLIELSETYDENSLTKLYKLKNMENKGTYNLDMKIVSSLIVSAAVEARRLDVLCFGILDLKEDKSKLIWF